MKQIIHRTAAIVATLCIAVFFSSTLMVELLGSQDLIATVKSLIVFPGLFVLVPALAITGGTGFSLAGQRKGGLINSKKKRMPIIAANGLLILLPSAIYLDRLAAAGSFETAFYAVQGLELVAGAINLVLMSLNVRDGLKLSKRMALPRRNIGAGKQGV